MHRTTRFTALAAVALALAGTTYAAAQDKSTKAKPPVTGADAACPMDDAAKTAAALQFLHTANRSEIEHGQLAMDRAQSPDVKQYAKHMIDEHTQADQKLTELAKKKGISLNASPADPVHAAVAALDKQLMPVLKSKSGAAFDAAYIGPELTEHMIVLGAVEQAKGATQDPQITALLDENHKMLTRHRDMGMKIVDTMRVGAAGKAIGGGPKSGTQK